eukprot:1160664-Pelagomonas_calceolata.AAC.6
MSEELAAGGGHSRPIAILKLSVQVGSAREWFCSGFETNRMPKRSCHGVPHGRAFKSGDV